MKKWMVYAKKADFQKIADTWNIDPVIARIIRNRDVISEEEMNEYILGTINDLHSPYQFKDMEDALFVLSEKIKDKKKIRIIGDYDIDGVCSSYILLEGLRSLGALVDVDIPDRILDGYGLNKNLISKAKAEGVDTVLTCDNGISALEEIEFAREQEMTVVVTDHHNPGEVIPNAHSVINPKRKDCPYPFKELCGAGVAYKLIQGLYQQHGRRQEEVHSFLEFVAIATIGDVVPLKGENRIIVKDGLRRLNATKNLGLNALIQANNLGDKKIGSFHIGFILGPCLNASGRLDTAKKALRLLETTDPQEAEEIAHELFELNVLRKDMTVKGYKEALELLEKDSAVEDPVIVVYLPECHESLAGIIAGRLREKYYKPAFVFTDSDDGLKGSGRSIEGYDMFAELRKTEDLLDKFGGHTMAAGLSLKKEMFSEFQEKINKNSLLTKEDFIRKYWIDTELPLEYLSLDFINSLHLLEPFGKGNEKPVFATREVVITEARIVGVGENVMKLSLISQKGLRFAGVCFEKEEFPNLLQGYQQQRKLSILYYPEINEYNGRRQIQVQVKSVD